MVLCYKPLEAVLTIGLIGEIQQAHVNYTIVMIPYIFIGSVKMTLFFIFKFHRSPAKLSELGTLTIMSFISGIIIGVVNGSLFT